MGQVDRVLVRLRSLSTISGTVAVSEVSDHNWTENDITWISAPSPGDEIASIEIESELGKGTTFTLKFPPVSET